ncbi:MAG: NADH-quinone oxidoreductase subunit N [Hydrogenibacillus sp.]|nr:NADH-quinone oxidoreductase subunit N [Hydrogenibacillus sp.]
MNAIWLPEVIVLAGAIGTLAFGLAARRSKAMSDLAMTLALITVVVALLPTVGLIGTVEEGFAGAFRIDGLTLAFHLLILIGTGLVLLIARDGRSDGVPPQYLAEYAALLLFAALGGMLIAAAADLLLLFLGLELLSISSYVLVGLKKTHLGSTEAAMKYVLTGATATAVFAFGMSYAIGLTGTTDVYQIGQTMADAGFMARYGRLLFVAFFFLIVGAFYKLASVPFYMWAPDVYQGAPTAVTAFLATVSKASGMALVVRLFLGSFAWVAWEAQPNVIKNFWSESTPYIAALSALSMIVGNVLALKARDVKRMFAYSSVAHAGYLIIPLAAVNPMMIDQIVFYLLAYLLANVGIFAVIDQVGRDRGSYDLSAFSGLYHRAPLVAWALLLFFLSLAGIPLTMGFFGKLNILLGAVWGGHFVLAGLLVVTSVISYVYYFAVLKQVFMRPGTTERPLAFSFGTATVIALAVLGTLLGSLFPGEVMRTMQQAFDAVQMFGIYQGRL